jgi:hypothetical protein
MSRDEIIERMGWTVPSAWLTSDMLDRIERIVRAAEQVEREAIARMFDGAVWGYDYREIAVAIRARGEKKTL